MVTDGLPLAAVTLGAAYTVWWISLAIGAVVILVVALLLTAVLRSARRIRDGVAGIWAVGQQIANNTVHVALLHQTNRAVADILASAGGIAEASRLIADHAAQCSGCPKCLTAGGAPSAEPWRESP